MQVYHGLFHDPAPYLAIFDHLTEKRRITAIAGNDAHQNNGLRLIVKEAHATELACVEVWVRAGGFVEDEATSGTAHVIEHLVFRRHEGPR